MGRGRGRTPREEEERPRVEGEVLIATTGGCVVCGIHVAFGGKEGRENGRSWEETKSGRDILLLFRRGEKQSETKQGRCKESGERRGK